MSLQRLAILVVFVAVIMSRAFAQKNEGAVTGGRTFISTQTILNDPASPNPKIHLGTEESFAFNYTRLLATRGIFGFSAEVPVAIAPRIDLNTSLNQIPKDFGALFLTPSARLNFFSGQALSPWLSVGGGWAHFREASKLNYFGNNPGPTSTNTSAVQFGIGFDVWPFERWGFRMEARDFYSGVPDLDVNTGRSRQHNYYVGVGVIRRF